MKIRILKRDLDAAIKHSWSTSTCLLAQVGKRTGLSMYIDITERSLKADMLMHRFDNCVRYPYGSWNRKKLKVLRASLPITINLP